jgi:hypothetical protein
MKKISDAERASILEGGKMAGLELKELEKLGRVEEEICSLGEADRQNYIRNVAMRTAMLMCAMPAIGRAVCAAHPELSDAGCFAEIRKTTLALFGLSAESLEDAGGPTFSRPRDPNVN